RRRSPSRRQARRGHAARGSGEPGGDRRLPRRRLAVVSAVERGGPATGGPPNAVEHGGPATGGPPNPLLTLEAVDVAYGKRRALEDVSLSVGDGEIVTLLGANGAGKSTTLRTISGLVRPARGRILYGGTDITRAAPDAIVARGIAHVPEARQIFPEFTVRENLLVGGHTRSRADELSEGIARAERLFPILGERARQRAATLSGGEQQMLAIARALMARPRLLRTTDDRARGRGHRDRAARGRSVASRRAGLRALPSGRTLGHPRSRRFARARPFANARRDRGHRRRIAAAGATRLPRSGLGR